MVNFSFGFGGFSGLLGLALILGSIGYLSISATQVREADRLNHADDVAVRLLQTVFGPIVLMISGLILLIQGWRLDPLLLFQNLLMSMLVGYLIISDWRRSTPTR